VAHQSARVRPAEWYGVYSTYTASTPRFVIQGKSIHLFLIPAQFGSVDLTEAAVVYTIQGYSQTLAEISGIFALVRIVMVQRGQQKTPVHFFYGKIRDLQWDLAKLLWPDGNSLLEYTTQKGRAFLRDRHSSQLATTKWAAILPPDFNFP
jgi:hypothetical protein